ncbi:MAG TPA: macro domain-containing protein [Thermoanaerobaculia bacterium]|nr:macro domain-containing protein [Thermoanaerobaculia bacterium]
MEIELRLGDITTLEVDAIVNAANSSLQHGGGVAAAIVRRGGSVIQQQSDRIGFVPVGSAAVTDGGSLPSRWVIHAVGPRMGEGDEERKLRDATRSALERAEELRARSVAFPAISTGIFGYPLDRCARIMTGVAREFAAEARSVERVIFCLFGEDAMREFRAALDETKG